MPCLPLSRCNASDVAFEAQSSLNMPMEKRADKNGSARRECKKRSWSFAPTKITRLLVISGAPDLRARDGYSGHIDYYRHPVKYKKTLNRNMAN